MKKLDRKNITSFSFITSLLSVKRKMEETFVYEKDGGKKVKQE
jgi:hypothetical protein